MARRIDQVRELQALVEAQSQVRDQQSQLAQASVRRAFERVTDFRDPSQTRRAVTEAVRVVQAAQRRTASVADGYMARSTSAITGRRSDTVGAVDVRSLRRKLPQDIIEQLADGRSISAAQAARAQRRVEAVPAEEVYGRIPDSIRFATVAKGKSEEQARIEGLRRAMTVADTDVMLAERAQVNRFLTERKPQGVVGYRRILHPELGSGGPPCGLCVVAADRLYRVEELMPIHARCIPEGTRVAADDVQAISRRLYSGTFVVLRTASGQEMTITANHPVLTSKGWVPAHLIQDGDDIVRHNPGHGVVGRSPHEGDQPPLIEDVWRAATVQGSLHRRVMPLAAEDFHGDGFDPEVDVVTANGLLARVGDVSFLEPTREGGFMAGHRLRPSLLAQGNPASLLFADYASSSGPVGCGRHGSALLPGRSGEALVSGVGAAADRYASLLEASPDDWTGQAVALGQGQLAFAGGVLLDDLLNEGVGEPRALPTRFDPAALEFTKDGAVGYAELGRDLLTRLAGQVQLDRVIEKRLVGGQGHVYNLHTTEGWYSADNLIVSNCRCTVAVATASSDPGQSLNVEDLTRIYQAAGGNTRNRLKTVRVEYAEHGELGPVIVNATQNFRGPDDFARTQSQDLEKNWFAELESLQENLEGLVARAGESSDVDEAIQWNRRKIRELNARLP